MNEEKKKPMNRRENAQNFCANSKLFSFCICVYYKRNKQNDQELTTDPMRQHKSDINRSTLFPKFQSK